MREVRGTSGVRGGGRQGLWASAKWYVASIMGDNHYERYLAYHRVNHPDAEPLSKREYYRERVDAAERNPSTRCC